MGVHVVRFIHTKHTIASEVSNAETGGVLTNMVSIDLTEQELCQKSPLFLEAMAACFSESVGELFLTDFMVASSAGKQKIETHGG